MLLHMTPQNAQQPTTTANKTRSDNHEETLDQMACISYMQTGGTSTSTVPPNSQRVLPTTAIMGLERALGLGMF